MKAYVSDLNQIMVAYLSVYGDFSPTPYNKFHSKMIRRIVLSTKFCYSDRKKSFVFPKVYPSLGRCGSEERNDLQK
jgi:hypothetical protein